LQILRGAPSSGALTARAGGLRRRRLRGPAREAETKSGRLYCRVQVAGAKQGVSFDSAPAFAVSIAVSYRNNHALSWKAIDGLRGWNYVIYFALFRS